MPYPKRDERARARSNYRQIRLTLTHERGDLVSYSIMAKPYDVEWHQRQVIVRDHVKGQPAPESFEDVIRLLLVVLSEQLLPLED